MKLVLGYKSTSVLGKSFFVFLRGEDAALEENADDHATITSFKCAPILESIIEFAVIGYWSTIAPIL